MPEFHCTTYFSAVDDVVDASGQAAADAVCELRAQGGGTDPCRYDVLGSLWPPGAPGTPEPPCDVLGDAPGCVPAAPCTTDCPTYLVFEVLIPLVCPDGGAGADCEYWLEEAPGIVLAIVGIGAEALGSEATEAQLLLDGARAILTDSAAQEAFLGVLESGSCDVRFQIGNVVECS